MDSHKFILEEKNINRVILTLSWPMVIAFLLQTSFNIVDGIFVGKLSTEALAAVSISFPVFFLMISLAGGLGIGTTSLIARSIGSKFYNKANNVAVHALLLAVVLYIFFSVTGLLFGKQLFSLISSDAALLPLVLEYMNIIFAGSIFMFLAFIANNILRGEGNMKTPMVVMGSSAVLNIILDPIFIFTLGLGVKGAAIATVISRAVSCIIVFSYILSGKSLVKLSMQFFTFSFKLIKEILFVGIPSSLSQVLYSFNFFIITGIVARFGAEAIAAFGIIFRVEGLAFLPVMGVMTAIMTIVGQNFGAGKLNRARKATFNASVMSAIFTFSIGLLFFIFSRPIAMLFNTNPNVVSYTSLFFLINVWLYPFFSTYQIITGSFLGAGKPIPHLLINIIRLFIVTLPLAFWLSTIYGLVGVWISFAAGGVAAGIVSLIWYRIVDLKIPQND
ncbi:MATE family efflux transporter [Candidatus Woesearchaeota archaeon]|nr:MATE family efflux transporter [Candidatus Woesearchaeota archaeon]